ncbi:hypothetical protein BYT27DRAFT_6378676 [Phlegmacium glaucopus]|nr:hypothetical protein BYT27DRAFT_6378676 [Phlegmacium glaucopus]
MLPNLVHLQCNVRCAVVLLARASKKLIRLSLLDTYNAQGLYLLSAIVPGGVLPALRSLGIHRNSGNSPKPREEHPWRDDDNGGVLHAGAKNSSMQFDGNYIMYLSKAAPNLEELELMGTSDDILVSHPVIVQLLFVCSFRGP